VFPIFLVAVYAVASWITIKTWMWTNSGYQLPSIFSKGKAWNFQRGKLCSLL